jgi:hypothetical protein
MKTTIGPLAACLLFCAAAGEASAQDIRNWTAADLFGPFAKDVEVKPTDAQLMAAWPAAAAQRKLEGNALARCKADAAGSLFDCQVVVERPARAGFGTALLSLAPLYHLKLAPQAEAPRTDVLISASWPAPDTAPDWKVALKPGDFSTTYTTALWRAGEPGFAVMNCLLGKMGDLYDCMVVYQSPTGKGVGTMVLRFAAYLRFNPAQLADKPVTVGLNIRFHLAAPGAAPAKPQDPGK